MADEDNDAAVTGQAAKSGGGLVKSLGTGAGIFAAVLLAQIVSPPITRMIYGDPNAAADSEEAVEEGAMGEGPVEPVNLDPALYVPLDPALVVSVFADSGESHFLQINVQAMSRVQAHADAIRDHAPAIRNSFLFVISNHSYDEVLSPNGKEALRRTMLAAAQDVMRQNIGEDAVEDLYFTSFVAQ
ncbi:MAG: flagellar basal body-associated FliL family protein [Gammaproteobacteria bacterium]|nr:flagellar basal body-associated FliL family protein [Gammaproteobacteria bacterium]